MNKGEEDCYFFYNAVCNKGDRCPFRHRKAAVGSRTVCSLWRENRCFRKACKFRHTELNDDRKDTYCHFETRPNGFLRVDCRFYHVMPRAIDGLHLPADKGPVPKGRCGVKARQQKSITTSSRPTSKKNRDESTADVEKSHKRRAVSPDPEDGKRPQKRAKACGRKTAEGKARPESDVATTPAPVTCGRKRKAAATSAPSSKRFKARCLEAKMEALVRQFEALSLGP
ncbi:zinc finger CCCH domain-containing protein 11A-like isoform X2 [Trichomycterus rosablanca]|uniref:zinc finger CCCH domain-containing protein 11A-like isoform X2 n=1 Tax=Trichomycterus rosablanca TaxID=2290929 RepID=UPI002F35E8AA